MEAVERFHRFCIVVVARLPFGLSSVVAPTFLGFCLINSFTFGVDLVLLYVMHGVWHLPVPIAVSVAYACAFALSYVLNRIFNFASHAPVGPQLGIYVVVVVVNYLAFILGVVQPSDRARRGLSHRTRRGRSMRGGVHVQHDALGNLPRLRISRRLEGRRLVTLGCFGFHEGLVAGSFVIDGLGAVLDAGAGAAGHQQAAVAAFVDVGCVDFRDGGGGSA